MANIKLFEKFKKNEDIINALINFGDSFLELFDRGYSVGTRVGTSYTYISIDFSNKNTIDYIKNKVDEIRESEENIVYVEVSYPSESSTELYEKLCLLLSSSQKMQKKYKEISGYDCGIFEVFLSTIGMNKRFVKNRLITPIEYHFKEIKDFASNPSLSYFRIRYQINF
jgi:hypothetical protein